MSEKCARLFVMMTGRWYQMTGPENLPHSSSCGVVLVCAGQSLPNTAQRRRKMNQSQDHRGLAQVAWVAQANRRAMLASIAKRNSCYFWHATISVVFFTWNDGHTSSRCIMAWRQPDKVMIWNRFYWETLGPAIHIDATLTRSTNLDADHHHSSIHRTFPDVLSFSRITHHATTQNR